MKNVRTRLVEGITCPQNQVAVTLSLLADDLQYDISSLWFSPCIFPNNRVVMNINQTNYPDYRIAAAKKGHETLSHSLQKVA